MATEAEARQAIIDNVAKNAPSATGPYLLRLAEALAWVSAPAQPHGGSSGSN
jgi:hypothetical protein